MKRLQILLAVLALSLTASASLTVEKTADGTFAIKRNGQTVLTDIVAVGAGLESAEEECSQTAGSAVWNRWNTNAHIRCEVVQRSDGAIEMTVAGHSRTAAEEKTASRRGIRFRLPSEVVHGKAWRAILGSSRSGKEGSGTFGEKFENFTTRYLVTDGLVLNLGSLGSGGRVGICGEWEVSPDGKGGARFSGVSWPTVGGNVQTTGAKMIIREGSFDDFSRDHFLRSFYLYWQDLRPCALVKFGSKKAGQLNDGDRERYADGNRPFDKDFGWLDGKTAATKVGYPNGAYYSHAFGSGLATYRFAGLPRGHYILTLQIGNWSGTENDFAVSVNGEKLRDGLRLKSRQARTISRGYFVGDGKLDVTFDGHWLISGIGVQPLLAEAEDYAIRRGFWFVDGYEPSPVFGNEMVKIPFVPAVLDQTIEMPEPGREAAGPRHEIPSPREVPDMTLPENRWVYELRMDKFLENSTALTSFLDDSYREACFRKAKKDHGCNAVMQNGQLSRHTFSPALNALADQAIALGVENAHKYGLKYIDHLDATLLWNWPHGFRCMMERLDETLLVMHNNLPCFMLCPSSPKLKKRLFAYLRKEVEEGVDGFQIDELTYWHHGCVCAHCREQFHRDTGWYLPLDETEGSSYWTSRTPIAQLRREWQRKNITNWQIELRRFVKDLNPNLYMSTYGIFRFMVERPTILAGFADSTRVMSCLGTEVMPRHPIRAARSLLPLMRLKNIFRKPTGLPAWDWFYPPDAAGGYYCWGLATMVAEAPLVNGAKGDPKLPDYKAWSKKARLMDPVGAKPIAKVGVFISTASINNGPGDDFSKEAFGLAQTLEALHVPYEFVGEMSREWQDVRNYDVYFLTHADCMDDRAKWLAEALIRDGRRVCGRPGCGSRHADGSLRKEPLKGFIEMPSAASFCSPELNASDVLHFNPDPAAEAAFRKTIAECVADASWWRPIRIPEYVQTSLLREKSGDTLIHFLNATGCDIRDGEKLIDWDHFTKTTFPELSEDIVFDIPSEIGNRVVALSPDFTGERVLHAEPVEGKWLRVTLPKELMKVYTLVRVDRTATISVDVKKTLGVVKPVHGVGQPPMIGALGKWSMMHYLQEAGIPFSRLHDVGGWQGQGLYVDIPNLFRNFEADENDPNNYTFAYTDDLLKALVENGVEPFFRLGVTIENFAGRGFPAVRTIPPKDAAKWARICEHVIRHYTEGWNKGFHYRINYWEIWNEPDSSPDIAKSEMWKGDWKSYCDFYGVVAPSLKARFPHLKIGGYGSSGFCAASGTPWATKVAVQRTRNFLSCAQSFLKRAQEEKWPLDFFSYHSYSPVDYAKKEIEYADALLNQYGFTRDRTERILDEWLTFNTHDNLGTARQAAAIAAELTVLQNGPCDVACLYDARCNTGDYSPLFNPMTYKPHKAYYALAAFNELRKLGTSVMAATDEPGLYVCAAAKDGLVALLIANPKSSGISLRLPLDLEVEECLLTDDTHTAAPVTRLTRLTPNSFVMLKARVR